MMTSTFFHVCSANPELLLRIIPDTDDVRDLAKLCLVNTEFRDFLFSTLPGRQAWLRTASKVTGYDGAKLIDVRVSDFQYQLKLLVCPWLSEPVQMSFDFPETTNRQFRSLRVLGSSRLLIKIDQDPDFEDGNDEEMPCFSSIGATPFKTKEDFQTSLIQLPSDYPFKYPETEAQLGRMHFYDGESLVPDFSTCTCHIYKHINQMTFAVIESIEDGLDTDLECITGGVYFMSMRDPYQPKLLRHIHVPELDELRENDLCSAPQRLWLTHNESISYFGPHPSTRPFGSTQLQCDKTDAQLDRMVPAIWRAFEGNAEGAIDYMKNEMRGMDLNTPSKLKGRTVLYYAVAGKNADTVKTLIRAKADVNQTDDLGNTPLMLAVSNTDAACTEALCGARADVNACSLASKKSVLLHMDAYHVSVDTVSVLKLLLSLGADPNRLDDNGTNIFFKKTILEDHAALKTLVSHGANALQKDNDGNTLLHVYFEMRTKYNVYYLGKPEYEKELKESCAIITTMVRDMGIDINAVNIQGYTALHRNLRETHPEEMRMMINEFKADLDVKNKQGLTIRDTLAGLKGALFEQDNKERFQELCKLLLEK